MKKRLFYMILVLATISFVSFKNMDAVIVFTEGQPDTEKDKLVSVRGFYIEGDVYINLQMLNETEGGFYSLVREYPDGSFESVEVKDIVVNSIGKPLLYSFADKAVPDTNINYVLYRISIESEEVQRWQYCFKEQKLCPHLCYATE